MKERELKSSSPPLTQEKLSPVIKQHKELIEYMQRNNDLPIDWPFCTFRGNNVVINTDTEYGGYIGECTEIAAWAIKEDYNDSKSRVALLCTRHFTQLPVKEDGSFYRVFRLTVRNYNTFLKG